ncbi:MULTISPECIES: hypothetical protein [unclassified Moraxella]|uniref:hypothetical protein n=1 Tax=unclassified Moraxella TaxID=2685852 RepID=UPI003AF97CEA
MAISTLFAKPFQLSALALAVTLAGCGGGGNDTLAPPINGGNGESGNSTTTASSKLNITAVSLKDPTGNNTTTIDSTGANASVKVTDGEGKPVSGTIVTFNATGGVSFGTTNGSVLTDANGLATISVKPTNGTDTGAYSLSATTTYNEVTATSPNYNFSLQALNLTLSDITLATSQLEVGGSTNVTLITKDANGTVQPNIPITFTASCGTFTNTSATSNTSGEVSTTYKAIDANGNLCTGGSAKITASTTTGTTKSATVTIASIQASSVVYTSTGEVKLGASNSGSSSSGQIEFTVYANGKPAANQEVIVSRVYAPNDFSFISLGNNQPKTLKSDSEGKISVTLYPGALPGPVELKATLVADANVTALSKDVSVATGRATQNGMSVSLGKNTLAIGVDGDSTSVKVMLVDRVGNAVPDGTVVSFVSEGGKITPNCSTKNGECEVTFTTQNPRSDGRLSVVAYVEGDKSYIDSNGNNKFDIGEPLQNNIGSFYRDDNENGQHDFGEYVYIRPITGSPMACSTSNYAQPNLITQILSTNPLQTVTHQCDNQLAAILRYEFVLGLAGNVPVFVPPFTTLTPNTIKDTPIEYEFKMYGNGSKTVSMPAGTTISVSTKDNTNFTPTATLVDIKETQKNTTTGESTEVVVAKRLDIANAEPNSVVKVNVGGTIKSIAVNSNGVASETVDKSVASVTLVDTNLACTAEFTSGNLTVPALVDLSNGRVSDNDVSYILSYKNCQPKDEIRITTNAPAPAANTVTKIVYVK